MRVYTVPLVRFYLRFTGTCLDVGLPGHVRTHPNKVRLAVNQLSISKNVSVFVKATMVLRRILSLHYC